MHPSGKRDSVTAGQLMYVQGMGGVIGRLNFPNLIKTGQKLGPVIINEAVSNYSCSTPNAQQSVRKPVMVPPADY